MKKYLFTTVFVALFFGVPFTHGLSYNDTIVFEVRKVSNTQENIDKAKLLRKYARDYKKRVNELIRIYEIPNSLTIQRTIQDIDTMSGVLSEIQTKSIEKSDAEDIISSIILGLKNANNKLKPILKQGQEEYQEELLEIKRNYIQVGNKISSALYNLIEQLSIKLNEKETLSSKEKEVVRSLVRLNETRDKIDKFKKINFGTKDEMKEYYIEIIKSIRTELKTIKNLLS